MTQKSLGTTMDETTYQWGRDDGIFFNMIRRSPDATRLDVSCEVTAGGRTLPQERSFQFSEPTLLTDDAIALTLSALYGRGHDNITFDLALSVDTMRTIKQITGALEVTALRVGRD